MKSVKEIMSKDVLSVSPSMMVSEAAAIMANNKVSCVCVEFKEDLLGILSERDIVLWSNKDISRLRVDEVMTTQVITVNSDVSIKEAAITMKTNKIRKLVVKEKGKIAGIVTETDILFSVVDELW